MDSAPGMTPEQLAEEVAKDMFKAALAAAENLPALEGMFLSMYTTQFHDEAEVYGRCSVLASFFIHPQTAVSANCVLARGWQAGEITASLGKKTDQVYNFICRRDETGMMVAIPIEVAAK